MLTPSSYSAVYERRLSDCDHAEVVMTEGVFFGMADREYKPVIKLMIEDVSQAAHTMSQEHTHPHTLCRPRHAQSESSSRA